MEQIGRNNHQPCSGFFICTIPVDFRQQKRPAGTKSSLQHEIITLNHRESGLVHVHLSSEGRNSLQLPVSRLLAGSR